MIHTRAAEPVEHEFLWTRENVGAVITDAERNISHQSYAALLRVRFDVSPLLMSDPLHVTKEIFKFRERRLFVVWETAYPVASIFGVLKLRRPLVPSGAAIVFLDEHSKERVIVQP